MKKVVKKVVAVKTVVVKKMAAEKVVVNQSSHRLPRIFPGTENLQRRERAGPLL